MKHTIVLLLSLVLFGILAGCNETLQAPVTSKETVKLKYLRSGENQESDRIIRDLVEKAFAGDRAAAEELHEKALNGDLKMKTLFLSDDEKQEGLIRMRKYSPEYPVAMKPKIDSPSKSDLDPQLQEINETGEFLWSNAEHIEGPMFPQWCWLNAIIGGAWLNIRDDIVVSWYLFYEIRELDQYGAETNNVVWGSIAGSGLGTFYISTIGTYGENPNSGWKSRILATFRDRDGYEFIQRDTRILSSMATCAQIDLAPE